MIVTIRNDDNLIDWGVTGIDRIIQNAKNIIRTRKYEVPFMRGMGISPDYMDATTTDIKNNIMQDVIDTLSIFEDRVSVKSIEIESVDESGNYVISVELEV